MTTIFLSVFQDGVGGSPNVTMTTSSDDVKSVLELDVNLNWSFEEVLQLMIDIGSMFDTGQPLDDDIAMFANGIIVSWFISI